MVEFSMLLYLYRFRICRDCYLDALKETGLCPGCKEPYKMGDYEDDSNDYSNGTLQLQGPDGSKGGSQNMSMMKLNQGGDFDHNKWLFESKGTYGVGNAYYDDYGDDNDDKFHEGMMESMDKPWKPLSRTFPIPASIISPYRFLCFTYLKISKN